MLTTYIGWSSEAMLMAPFGCRGNMELGGRFWTKECSEMSADHKIHLGDAFLFGNGFGLVLFLFHGTPRAGYSHSYHILVTKITLEMLFHLGTVSVPYFLFLGSLMPGFCHQLTFQSIPWIKTFPLAPCSRGTRRVPQARLRWPIQSMTLDTYHILFHTSPNAGFELDLAMVTVN